MKYNKKDAKAYSRKTMKGIWAAALTPFKEDGAIDEDGFRRNIDHWVNDLGIEGLFISGKQGEFFSMSVEERKRTFDIAVEATGDTGQTIMSCSDQNLDVVLDLAKHAQKNGSDYIVVHAPMLHFCSDQDELVYEYYKHISEQVDIGIAMWSHPDSGYLMSPELCNRIADLDNIVAIKYSVPRDMYTKLNELAGDKILVSTASEEEWLDNIIDLNWQLYLCSSPPYIIQTKNDRRMHDYTQLAFAGKHDEARAVWESLQPLRQLLKSVRPGSKPQAYQKYWQDLLGQTGGHVRRPMIGLTQEEKRKIEEAFDACDLKL
ncbi:dihydrodipicolinate synthase family protein [Curvivirga sp.]|uniref:dihydrodipicolinate synthase family protein n=1 Tax=Curvivirga sp. TaxID=2856848 RepID=UPI003B5944D3